MLKVIRKYNKWILAVGGTLLLVAFLMPQAIQQLGKARLGRTVATLDGRGISAGDYQTAVAELNALQLFFSHLDRRLPLPLDERNEVEHWLLLREEAEGAGLVGGAREGETLLPIFAEGLVRQVYVQRASQFGASASQLADYFMASDPEGVQTLTQRAMELLANARARAASSAQLTGEQFDKGLARLQGVSRLITSYQQAERISDRQTASIAKKLADSALVDAVFLSGRDLADGDATPTDEQLAAHFDRFRTLAAGEGEFGIGYKLPQRVKVEWIELDRQAVEDAITIGTLEANKHWQQNRDRYPGEYAEESERVIGDLRRAKTERIMGAAESLIRSEIARALRPLPEAEHYVTLPDDWGQRRPSYSALADQVVASIAATENVNIPRPRVEVRAANWLDARALSQLEGIGGSIGQFAGQRGTFAQFVLSVRELAGPTPLGLQMGVPAIDLPTVSQSTGNRYIYTVLDTADAEVPTSIDQLLDAEQIVEEWRALQKYESLVAGIADLEAQVVADGIEAFAASFGTIEPETPETDEAGTDGAETDAPAEDAAESEGENAPDGDAQESGEQSAGEQAEGDAGEAATDAEAEQPEEDPAPEPMQRVTVLRNARVFENRTNGLSRAENSPEVIEAVRARAREIDPLSPIDEVPLAERVVGTPVPSRLGVLVAQINGVQPLTYELLPAYADGAQQQRWRETVGVGGLPFPFQFGAISQRHTFALKGDFARRSESDGATTPDEGGTEEGTEGETAETEG